MTNGRQQVVKIGRYYYVDDYNAKTSLALSSNIQNARWFDFSLQHHKKQMDAICLNYGGEVRDLLDELQANLTGEKE
ncbi:hypothetical protein [Enterococcus lactis]|uniref:hypothetical protein n=1 Tax=Enterococcus lactis TaxID=357441 RepID=UPI002412583B|nr:hypothetical protein [Enterococcus lactis]